MARFLGQRSEAWLWRQIVGLTLFDAHVITWAYINQSDYPLGRIVVNQLPFKPAPEDSTLLKRWFYRFRNLPSANFYGSIGKEKAYIHRLLLDIKPQVILCHFGQTALRILPVAKDLGIPLVAHFHGMDISSNLANKWYRWSLIHQVKQFAAIVVVSNHQRQWFLDHNIPESCIHVIPCGVPTAQFEPTAVRPNGTVRFVTVSRINKQKGIDYTIKAFLKVFKVRPDVHLNIVGDGEEMNTLKDLVCRLEIAHKVTFSGSCPPPVVKQHLAEAHIFLQHSTIREGSSVSIMEAAAMELPIVATRCGGIMDHVVEGQTGYLVDQKNVDGMAEAMEKLANDVDLRVAMGKAGRARMMQHFDTKKQVARLENAILGCCRD